jgi:flagellar biosynthesis protein FliP
MANEKTYAPKVLANEIGCDPKSLRGFLRKAYPRAIEAKNTSWIITEDAANAAREHFAKQKTDANATAPANEANVNAAIATLMILTTLAIACGALILTGRHRL